MRLRWLAVACALVVTIGSANALPFNWSLSGDDPSFGITGSGTLTASETGGQFTVDSFAGEVSDSCTGTACVPQFRTVIGLLTPHQAYGGLSDIGGDNLIFPAPASSFLDSQGIVFAVGGIGSDPCPFAAGCYMRIYAPSPGVYDLFVSNAGANGVDFVLTAVNPVPEPATWMVMVIGFAAVGFTGLRRRSKAGMIVA